MIELSPGQRVRLSVPENPRLHGKIALVETLTEWGAHVRTEAAATGQFRALWSEMSLAEHTEPAAREKGYEGEPCHACGALTLRRNGACLLCDSCGATSGCS